jgi:hypothetical protein
MNATHILMLRFLNIIPRGLIFACRTLYARLRVPYALIEYITAIRLCLVRDAYKPCYSLLYTFRRAPITSSCFKISSATSYSFLSLGFNYPSQHPVVTYPQDLSASAWDQGPRLRRPRGRPSNQNDHCLLGCGAVSYRLYQTTERRIQKYSSVCSHYS